MSIENGVFNSCTPAECYVYKQVASWVIIAYTVAGVKICEHNKRHQVPYFTLAKNKNEPFLNTAD